MMSNKEFDDSQNECFKPEQKEKTLEEKLAALNILYNVCMEKLNKLIEDKRNERI